MQSFTECDFKASLGSTTPSSFAKPENLHLPIFCILIVLYAGKQGMRTEKLYANSPNQKAVAFNRIGKSEILLFLLLTEVGH